MKRICDSHSVDPHRTKKMTYEEYCAHKAAEIDDLSMAEPNTGCILYLGRAAKNGYPQMHFRGKTKYVFHVALHVFSGVPWASFSIYAPFDHRCDNKQCINVKHIKRVSQRENILRGRSKAAQNARKTHCPQGHPLSGDNLVKSKLNRKGQRGCRICANKRCTDRYHRNKNK